MSLSHGMMGDRSARTAMYRALRAIGPHLLFCQGMRGADADHEHVMYEASYELGLRGWLGEGSHTAVFADMGAFRPVGELRSPSTVLVASPTAVAFQLDDAGLDSLPLCAVSGTVSSGREVLRRAESQMLSRVTASMVTLPGGRRRRALVVGGFDAAVCPDPERNILPRDLLAGAGLCEVAPRKGVTPGTAPPAGGFEGWVAGSGPLAALWKEARTAEDCGLRGHGTVAWADRDAFASLLNQLALPAA
ncbi:MULTISPECIES: hypothetical protein [unclassified Streptomyces]|uniref:hypothetical protein n=1 Tax=unclassified Streptomyces TaxID=2593676 RepID=UPI00136833BD|nr:MULTISPECIES: hypothetical protein [unclassified Streptomyces]MYZ37908.1 hypothetical protein [Streptomyces sp. SID4917]